MAQRFKVKKVGTQCQVFCAQFDSNGNQTSGETKVLTQGEEKQHNGKTYACGPRSPSDSSCCIFEKQENVGGAGIKYKEVWDEQKGWIS
ncbi:hypothetical protein [Nitrosomonas sp.]|uniref:hypothetical protein n=1 Tax=Nitrosomonas sp. TaxID=42353 RepID=UPI001DC0BAC7|nr:hypothetical protein [Nitrosomonas sp.]MCB1948052.1 hypothetical protein [Nitrosomonas sp.]